MQNAGQYGQGGTSSHQSVPFGHTENTTPGGSTTSSLRQFRKKNDDKPPLGDAPAAVAESHVARVAPHNHYPPPVGRSTAAGDCYPRYPATHHYPDYGVHAQVKYSEISEGQQMQDHVSSTVIQKVKGKEYMEMCNVAQPHMKQPYDILNSQQSYHETNLHPHAQYIPKEPQVNPTYKPESQYFPKDPPPPQQYAPHHAAPPHHHLQQQQQKYVMPPAQQPPKYHPPQGNDFLSKLRRINPSMARSIMSDHHLQETQMAYQSMDQRGMYAPQNQRYVNYPSMQPTPYGHMYAHPAPAYSNYPPSCTYGGRPPQMAPRYQPDREAAPRGAYQQDREATPRGAYQQEREAAPRGAFQQDREATPRGAYQQDREATPRGAYQDGMLGYGVAPPQKMSPGYRQYDAPEYAQHYQHRRGAPNVAQEYYSHYRPSQYHPHQMSAQEMPEARVTVSDNIKQYIENWADEETASEMNQSDGGRMCKEGPKMRDDPSNETVYMINASDIQYLENGIPVLTSDNMVSENAQYIIKGIDPTSGMVRIIGKNGQMEIGEIVDHIKPDCMLANKPNDPNQRHPNENPYSSAEKSRVVVHQNTVIQSSYHAANASSEAAYAQRPENPVKIGSSLPMITDNLEELNRRLEESRKETVDKNCSPINIEQIEDYGHPSVICPNKALEEELAKIQESSSSDDSLRSMPFIDPFTDTTDSKITDETASATEEIDAIQHIPKIEDSHETKVQDVPGNEAEVIPTKLVDSNEKIINKDDETTDVAPEIETAALAEDTKTETAATIIKREEDEELPKVADVTEPTEQIESISPVTDHHEILQADEPSEEEVQTEPAENLIEKSDGSVPESEEHDNITGASESQDDAKKPREQMDCETDLLKSDEKSESSNSQTPTPIEKSTARRSRRIFSVDDIMNTIGNNINKHDNEAAERRHSLQTTAEFPEKDVQHTLMQLQCTTEDSKDHTLDEIQERLDTVRESEEGTIRNTDTSDETPKVEKENKTGEISVDKVDEEKIIEHQELETLLPDEKIETIMDRRSDEIVERMVDEQIIEESLLYELHDHKIESSSEVDTEDIVTDTPEEIIPMKVENSRTENVENDETISETEATEISKDITSIEHPSCSLEEMVIEELLEADPLRTPFLPLNEISSLEQQTSEAIVSDRDSTDSTSETACFDKQKPTDTESSNGAATSSAEPVESVKEPVESPKEPVESLKGPVESPKEPVASPRESAQNSPVHVWEERQNEIQYRSVLRVEESSVLLHIAGELVEITVNTVNGKKVITVVPISDTPVADLNDNYETIETVERNDPLSIDESAGEGDNVSEVVNFQVVAPEVEIVETTSEIIIGMDLSLEEEIKLDVDPPIICTKAARKAYDTDLQIPSITTSEDVNDTTSSPTRSLNDKVSSTKERVDKHTEERKVRIEKLGKNSSKNATATKTGYSKRLAGKLDKKSAFKNLIEARNTKKAKQEQKDSDEDFVPFKELVKARKLKKLKLQELKKSQDEKIDSTIRIDEFKKDNNLEEPVVKKRKPVEGKDAKKESKNVVFNTVSMENTNHLAKISNEPPTIELKKIEYRLEEEKSDTPSSVEPRQEKSESVKEVVPVPVKLKESKKVEEIRNYRLEDPRLKERLDGSKPKYPEPKKKLSLEEYNRRKRKLAVETQNDEVEPKTVKLDTSPNEVSDPPPLEVDTKPVVPKRIRFQRPKSLDDLNSMKPKENKVLSRKMSVGSSPIKPNSFDWEDTQSPKSNLTPNGHVQRFSEFSGLINNNKPVISQIDDTLQSYKDQVESKLSSLNIQIPSAKPVDKLPANPLTEPKTKILMQKFLKNEKLTSEEMYKVKKIISYKRLMQQMRDFRAPEVGAAIVSPSYEIKKELGENETKLHLKKVHENKKRKFRIQNLSNSDSEEEDFRDRSSGDYSVVQANCLAGVVPKLIIKRKTEMPLPVVRLERLDLELLGERKRYVV